ncbi:MAG: hypothetical protein EAX96_07945 [Candidatus Lokiarchaeota archaeon]|nr:hypothetical protein [Candidatus Lokiarchaeota archaeon]
MNNTKSLLLYFIPLFSFMIFTFSLVALGGGRNLFYDLIPLIQAPLYIDLLFIFFIIPLAIIIVGLCICPLITMLYYGIHRIYRLFSKEHGYGVLELKENIPFKRLFYRLIFPAFLAISMGMTFNFTFSTSPFLNISASPTFQIFMASIFFSVPTFAVLAPLWILDDSGIICFLKKDINYRRPPETESISRFYSNAYKGYTGITFAFSFINVIFRSVLTLIIGLHNYFEFLLIFLLIGFPFILSSYFVPFCIIYEKYMNKFVKILYKVAKVDKIDNVIEKIE